MQVGEGIDDMCGHFGEIGSDDVLEGVDIPADMVFRCRCLCHALVSLLALRLPALRSLHLYAEHAVTGVGNSQDEVWYTRHHPFGLGTGTGHLVAMPFVFRMEEQEGQVRVLVPKPGDAGYLQAGFIVLHILFCKTGGALSPCP